MKTLEQYLATAKSYLYPNVPDYFERDRETILNFVKKHNLEGDFNKQVETNHVWRKLSESTQVFYYIDSPSNRKHNPNHNDEEHVIVPSINLMIWTNNQEPVIKIVMP